MSALTEFQSRLESYKQAKEDYESKLETFEQTLNQVVANHESASSDVDIQEEDTQVTTSEGVVMNASTAEENELNGDLFVSSAAFQGGPYSNTFVQVGLDGLNYNSNSKLNNDVYNMETSAISSLDSTTDCTVQDLYRCDSYAKMENKNYYGLGSSEDSCHCYVMDTMPTTKPKPEENISIRENVSYLAILFDGTLSTLKQSNYSNNFTNAYTENTENKEIIIDSDSLKKNVCNPFTGSGINSIDIQNINCLV